MEGKAFEQAAVCDRPITSTLGLCFVTNVLRWLVVYTPEPDQGSKDAITGRIAPNTAFRRLGTFRRLGIHIRQAGISSFKLSALSRYAPPLRNLTE